MLIAQELAFAEADGDQVSPAPQPVLSDSGTMVETANSNALWSGGRGSVLDLGYQRYELAQEIPTSIDDSPETASVVDLLWSGASLLALVAGLASRGGLAEVSSAEEGEDQQSAPQTGTVIKGPLSGALVFADQNSTGQFDDGEPNTIKDENGD